MSAQKIQAALGLLEDDPENELAWTELADVVTDPDPGMPLGELKSLLEAARRGHETRREWDAVARVLELEMILHAGTPVELAMLFEHARVLDEECFETEKAEAAYARLLQLRPGDDSVLEVIERHRQGRANWRSLADDLARRANAESDALAASSLHFQAAELLHRFGGEAAAQQAVAHLERAVELAPTQERAATLLERIHTRAQRFEDAARVAAIVADSGSSKETRAAALLRLARIARHKLDSEGRASAAYERVLDLYPGHREAMAFLSSFFSGREQWDHLVALYEDQLRGGGTPPGEEAGIIFQIAMVHWRMRGDLKAAEPWFDRLRRLQPAHRGMLDFYREHCAADEGRFRLMTVLSDAQRAMSDGPEKAQLAAEIAKLAEEGANAQKAIEQYKTLLRAEPDNREARDALKRLYVQTEGWNALIELLRQELERVPAEDTAARASILREIAAVYRDHIKSDTALVTVLSQLVQLDETDLSSLRELLKAYEALGRFRDLLQHQAKLAKALPHGQEKIDLLRDVARRWISQFSNVQNATEAYEALLEAVPDDEEARTKLRELYLKRRAFAQLFSLYEREATLKDGAEKYELLAEMAKLAAERLDRGADAIRLYKEILAAEPSRTEILDALERQAEREKDFASVVEALELRLSQTADDAARIVILQKLGTVAAEKLGDTATAARAFKRVLEIQPGHARALRILRDAFMANGDFDGLEDLYASQNDWEGLAEVLSNAADRAEAPEQKVELSFRAARIFVEKLGSRERAFRSYERILSVRPNDRQAAEALVPLYEQDEKWARLPALYEVLLEHAEGGDKLPLFEKLVEVTGKRLNDAEAALAWAKKAHEECPSDGTLEMLETASRTAKSWDVYIATVDGLLAKKGRKKAKAAEKRSLRKKLAHVYANELARLDDAIAVYRSLVEEDPEDFEIVEAFDRLLRATDRRDDLRWLFERRIEKAADAAKTELFVEWATLEEDAFSEPERAIALHRRVLAIEPGHASSLKTLQRLLSASGDLAGVARLFEEHREHLPVDAQAENDLALAELYLGSLDQPEAALDSVLRALEQTPGDARSLALLEKLVALPATRARAARALERELAAVGDAPRQARALQTLIETTQDADARIELFLELAALYEDRLLAPHDAFDVVLRALAEAPTHSALWDRAAELGDQAGRLDDLAAAYRSVLAPNAQLPEALEIELCDRAARLHDDRLGNPAGATPYLERLLARDPTDERAFARLKQIFTSLENWAELQAIYERAAQATTDPARRVELLHEVALVCEGITDEADKAIGHYERILDIEPLHEDAIRALDRLYEKQGLWTKLAASLEKQLATAGPSETVDLKVRRAQLGLERLAEVEVALVHLEEVLALDPTHYEAKGLLERFLDLPEQRLRAARALEPAYELAQDAGKLVRVLNIRLESAEQDARGELLYRIAELYEQLQDEGSAFEAYARLVLLDPSDTVVRERTVEIGRRLAAHQRLAEVLEQAADRTDSADLKSEVLLEAARIFEDFLGDSARAEAIYRRALDVDRSVASLVLPAAHALDRLYSASGRHGDLAEVLQLRGELEEDPNARKELQFRLADLYEVALADPARAIAVLQARFEDDPSDDEALAGLERLYEKTSAHADLERVLRARADLAMDADLRRALMVRRARLLADSLGDHEGALTAWQAVRDDFGPDPVVLAALASLQKATERWDELTTTLEEQLTVAEEPEARLALLAELGELRRSRQNDWVGALEALRQALTLDPTHAASRASVAKLLDSPDARYEAALLLHPLYEAEGDHARLLSVIEIEIASEDDPTAKLALFERAVRLAEGSLNDDHRAFALAAGALKEAAGDSQLGFWVERLEHLAGKTNRWAELASLLGELVGDILDPGEQLEITLKLAGIASERLGDRDLARDSYVKALDLHDNEPRALKALDAIYQQANDVPALLDILERRAESSLDDEERKEIHLRKARLLESQGEAEQAIASYERVLDIASHEEAIAALDRLYGQAERWGDLIALCERRLDDASDKASLYVRIATLYRDHLLDFDRAFDSVEDALRAEPRNARAIELLEAWLQDRDNPELRARAAEILEPVYLQRTDFKSVIATIDARLAITEDPYERRPLLRRLATLQEEQAEDLAGALETLAKVFVDDPSDEEVRSELERLAKGSGKEARLAEILEEGLAADVGDETAASLARRAAEIHAQLGSSDRAIELYRRSLTSDPASLASFAGLDQLLRSAERHDERAALHRDMLDHCHEPAERIELLRELAEIERGALGAIDRAVETYRQVLELDPDHAGAVRALEAIFIEHERHLDLAELYQLLVDRAPSTAEANERRLRLARVHRDRLSDLATAVDAYEQILQTTPNHREAVADLEAIARESELAERALDILRSAYKRLDDWRSLVTLLGHRFEAAEDVSEKVLVLREVADLWESRGGDLQRALGALERAFELAPEDGELRSEVERIAAQIEAWDELAELYERALPNAEPLVQFELLTRLTEIHDDRRGDLRSALSCYRRLAQLDATDPGPLDAADELALMLGDWSALADVLAKKIELAQDDFDRAKLHRRLADVRHDMLDDAEGAIAAYEHALEIDANDVALLDRLIALYEAKGDAARLVDLYDRRVENRGADETELAFQLLLAAAQRFEKDLEDRREAIFRLQSALDLRPNDKAVLTSLARLLEAEELWSDLLDNLRLQASLAETSDERTSLRKRIAALFASKIDDATEAIETYRLVLDEAPRDVETVEALLAFGSSHEDLREVVVDALEPVLRSTEQWDLLVRALHLRLDAQEDREERARTRHAIATVLDESLGRPADALALLLEGLAETPADPLLHEDLERLAAASKGWTQYAEALEARIAEVLDDQVATSLHARLGVIHAERLDDAARAIAAFSKALETGGEDAEILARLDELHQKQNAHAERAEILKRRIEIESEPSLRAELLHRLGRLHVDELGDVAQGIDDLRRALDVVPDHAGAREALEALADKPEHFDAVAELLDEIYRQQGDSDRQAKLFEKRISLVTDAGERVRLRTELARLLEDRSGDTKRAQSVLEDALSDAPLDPALLGEIERLAAIHDGWESAARKLASLLEEHADLDPVVVRDTWLKIAGFYEEKLNDLESAESAFEKALARDDKDIEILRALERTRRREGREAELVGTLRKMAELEEDPPSQRELLREAKAIADRIDDAALCESVLRQILLVDDADLWALEELTKVRDRLGDHDEVVGLLLRRADLVDDSSAIALRRSAAEIARDRLNDSARAIGILEGILELDAADERTSSELRRLYAASERFADLAQLLTRLVPVAKPHERAHLSLEIAKIQAEKLGSPSDAIDTLRQALGDDSDDAAIVIYLSGLYEEAHRDDDLAELLSSQIALAKSRGNADTELSLTIRLAEMLESRLAQPEKAIEAYRSALACDPTHPGALQALVRLHEARGELADAARALEKLFDQASGDELVALASKLASLHSKLGDDENARRVLEKGLEIAPRDATLREGLAEVYERTHAFGHLAQLLTEDAEQAETVAEKIALYRRAAELHLTKRGDAASAVPLLEKASELASDDRELLLLLCDAYSASGRGKDAAAALEKIVASFAGRRTKELASVHFRLSRAYKAEGDLNRALVELDQAFRIDPGSIPILKELGALSLETGDLEKAQRTYRALLLQKLEPGAPITKGEVFYYLGEISHRLGDKTRAVQMLERALENEASLDKVRALLDDLKK